MSDSRDQMISALRESVIPVLRQMGFSGSFPHFRRIREQQVDLLTVQLKRYGGSFVVEIAFASPEGFTTHWSKPIPAKRLTAHDIHPKHRLRLGSNPPTQTDYWFYFEPEQPGIYGKAASELLALLPSEAERFWQTHEPSMA